MADSFVFINYVLHIYVNCLISIGLLVEVYISLLVQNYYDLDVYREDLYVKRRIWLCS